MASRHEKGPDYALELRRALAGILGTPDPEGGGSWPPLNLPDWVTGRKPENRDREESASEAASAPEDGEEFPQPPEEAGSESPRPPSEAPESPEGEGAPAESSSGKTSGGVEARPATGAPGLPAAAPNLQAAERFQLARPGLPLEPTDVLRGLVWSVILMPPPGVQWDRWRCRRSRP